MKRGDLEPDLVVDITGDGADLNGVASWRIIGTMGGEVVFDSAPTVTVDPVDPSKAVVTRTWVAGDTDSAGVLLIEVEATWPGGRPQTFPSSGHLQLRIRDDLG
jgi:hypothetical protein